jgi:hypothetical protein
VIPGVVAANYQKQLPPVPYTVIWQDVLLGNGEGRRTYDGVPYDFQDFVMNWPGGNRPGWNLQFQIGAFMEASSGGHWVALVINGTYVFEQSMSEPGGGANLLTNWYTCPQSLAGAMYVYDGASFADNAHFKFVDVYYRYIRT